MHRAAAGTVNCLFRFTLYNRCYANCNALVSRGEAEAARAGADAKKDEAEASSFFVKN